MTFPDKRQVEEVRRAYPIGTTVRCVSISDPYTEIPPLARRCGACPSPTPTRRFRRGLWAR